MRTRIASAGTGKTTYLITRILALILSGTPLRRIAAVTYTRRASADLTRKLRDALETLEREHTWLDTTLEPSQEPHLRAALRELDGSNIGTIHSFMGNLLRLVAPTVTLDPDFSVLGEPDALTIYREELATHAFLTGQPVPEKTQATLETLFRQRCLAPTLHADGDDTKTLLALHEMLLERYRARLDNRTLAPADLELKAVDVAQHEHVLARWRERVRVVIVDEAQDLNPTQGAFFGRLEAGGIEVEAVGDPKQSIYAFRHADLDTFRAIIAASEQAEPLGTSYRHSGVLTRFLNTLTSSMGSEGRGFNANEAPAVKAHREETGWLEVQWVVSPDRTGIDNLRAHEADLLAHCLKRLHEEQDVPYREMAILMRSRASQSHLEAALAHHGVPTVIVQGRNYYRQSEIRDLVHALKLIYDPNTLSLAAWLHSPYGGLDTRELHAVLKAEDAMEHLKAHHPVVLERLDAIRILKNHPPAEILARLARDPLIDGRAYTELLDAAAADNVDTMLVLAAPFTTSTLDTTIHALEELAEQEEVGDVPQSGNGVRLTTIHASKGLEWPVVAVFDLGRGNRPRTQDVLVQPHTGIVAIPGSAQFEALAEQHKQREEMEGYRLLYVALSRARDHMIVTGSVKQNDLTPAIREFASIRLGPGKNYTAGERSIIVRTHDYQPLGARSAGADTTPDALEVTPWSTRRYPLDATPLILRPSHAQPREHASTSDQAAAASAGPGEAVGAIIGTLSHYALAQGWSPNDPTYASAIASQVILAPLDEATKTRVISHVTKLLATYQGMRGREVPTPAQVAEEYRELPFLHVGEDGRIWNGIIDHLYRIQDGTWVLDDYKTDRDIEPEKHEAQMRLYGDAAVAWTGSAPTLRLVYLRHGKVHALPPHATSVTEPLSVPA